MSTEEEGKMSIKEEADADTNLKYLYADTLNDHLISSTTISYQQFYEGTESYKKHRCDICGKLYKTASTLRSHKQFKHSPQADASWCKICNKQYASVLSLRKHQRYMHLYEHRCIACYRSFKTEELLEEHMVTCSHKKVPCPVCGNIYKTVLALRSHTKYKHANENWCMCSLCHRTFRCERSLANHMSTVHPPDIHCETCGKMFTSAAALQSHVLHKHDKNGARCGQCYKMFPTVTRLERHTARIHQASKYTCRFCKIDFYNSCHLVQHVLSVHKDENATRTNNVSEGH